MPKLIPKLKLKPTHLVNISDLQRAVQDYVDTLNKEGFQEYITDDHKQYIYEAVVDAFIDGNFWERINNET